MIKVAYADVENLDLNRGYSLADNDRKKKIDRYKFIRDKKLCCGAYLLLRKMLIEENIIHPSFKLEKYGKAYITNYDNIHFNLSHSRKYVACAVSDTPIGVDIEYNDPEIDLSIAKNFFFNSEYRNILQSPHASEEFFNYWVLKESYMKYTGLGFNLELDKFEILINEEISVRPEDDVKFSLFDVDEYKLAVANRKKVEKPVKYDVNYLINPV